MNIQAGRFFKGYSRGEFLWEKVMVPMCHIRCRAAKAIGVWSPRASFIDNEEFL